MAVNASCVNVIHKTDAVSMQRKLFVCSLFSLKRVKFEVHGSIYRFIIPDILQPITRLIQSDMVNVNTLVPLKNCSDVEAFGLVSGEWGN